MSSRHRTYKFSNSNVLFGDLWLILNRLGARRFYGGGEVVASCDRQKGNKAKNFNYIMFPLFSQNDV